MIDDNKEKDGFILTENCGKCGNKITATFKSRDAGKDIQCDKCKKTILVTTEVNEMIMRYRKDGRKGANIYRRGLSNY